MTVLEAIRNRRSTKVFAGTPVTREQIETLLGLAVLAPNHRMTAPWRLLVLGPDARRAYGQVLGGRKAKKVEDAEAARVIVERTVADAVAAPSMIAAVQRLSDDPEIVEEDYAGYETNDADAPNWGSSTDLEDNTWDVGVELRVPIPNIGRREQRKRAEIELQKIQTAWVDLERQIEQEITSAHRAVETSETGLAILAKTVEQAQKNLELINGSFEVGYSTITEVPLAQDDLFDAQTRYNNTLLNYQIAIAQYYVAVGQTLY